MIESSCVRADHAEGDCTTVQVLALMEATAITGPVKNLIEFAVGASQQQHSGSPKLNFTVVTFQRGKIESSFVAAARHAGLEVIIIHERFAFDPSILDNFGKW